MSTVLIPLASIYEYDDTIFDGLQLPTVSELQPGIEYVTPITPLSLDTLRTELLFCLGELSPVYSEPVFLKKMIESWSKVRHNTWLRLWQTMLYKYNPIWNKDGSYTENVNRSGSSSGNNTTNYGRTDAHNVTGYNTNAYSPDTQDVAGGSDRGSSSGNYSDKETRTRRETGNIGVTTTQQMLKEERDVAAFNIYNFIIDDFKSKFMITVY